MDRGFLASTNVGYLKLTVDGQASVTVDHCLWLMFKLQPLGGVLKPLPERVAVLVCRLQLRSVMAKTGGSLSMS